MIWGSFSLSFFVGTYSVCVIVVLSVYVEGRDQPSGWLLLRSHFPGSCFFLKKLDFMYFIYVYMCIYYVYVYYVWLEGSLWESALLPSRSWESDSGSRAWQQVTLPTETSYWPPPYFLKQGSGASWLV